MEEFVNGSSVNVGYDGGELDVSVFCDRILEN